MKIYSISEETKELLPSTLHDADYIDACTISIPLNSVIADNELPILSNNQAYIVTGTRNQNGYFTVTENVTVINDYRGQKVYLKTTGEEIEHKELGALPNDVTTIPPIAYSVWSESKNKWVEKPNAKELRLKDRRIKAGYLTRNQLLTVLEIHRGDNKEKLVEIATSNLTGVSLIKVRNALLEAQTFTLTNDDMWQFFTEILAIDIQLLFEMWEEAQNNY
ncbi:Caudovirales tail fiber assembly protein [Snodgrassella alvi SCGC AB-598-O02]|nr:hypothetical protein [Snodgrassella alvi]KES11228.1 Caudovirales tail fiber assembly protein [Snodgrassella alvi SCGC AB-598-O02]